LIGATEDGTKELLAVVDGYRKSTQSWGCTYNPEYGITSREPGDCQLGHLIPLSLGGSNFDPEPLAPIN
jgi:hypothetical protein